MKKTIMSLAVVSALLSGSAMADLTGGQADNSASTATLNFSGKVTSSLCQVNTSELTKTISLGEASAAALATGGQSPFQSFTVGLSNCDPTTANITYTIRDGNGLPGQSAKESDYLIPKSGDTSASGVGVYIADSEHKPIKIGANQTAGVTQVGGQAESEQTIALTAYIKAVNGDGNVKPGVVDATGIMTIKAAAAGDA
ncbi:fimbrial protein [Escherichia albertii]|uniref:fimbrial protein n=1 Tax=Escherichia albertii TaxID=208962 RepID=UPI003F479A70